MEYNCSPAKRRKISHDVGSSGDDGQSSSRKKLLVLDINGLLVDIVPDADVVKNHKPDTVIASKAVFKRPFCDEFLEFCFQRFRVGVWTSRTRRNITRVLDFLMKDTQHQLLFCWDQSHCTETGYNTIENTEKPLLLKELKKLWENQDSNLPWDRGVYDSSNTLLLDDSPYKALRNPPYTAIFPYTYSYLNAHDNGLGPDGDLRNYLERLAESDNVQKFIERNPFGQPPITRDNESWDFYHNIICSRSRKKLIVIDMGGLLLDVVTVPLEGFKPDTTHGSRAVFKRPYCDEFLQFCFQRFNVGVWTSTTRHNTERALDFLMRDTQHKLLFCWDLEHCTDTGFRSVENNCKNIILKELRKLWEKKDPNLPWELGAYDESNTLLVENVSHRGLLNPPHTAIFPYPYRYWNTEDNSIGPNGNLRVYLERLAASENVQKFVSENPFGQRPIREKNLSWPYYQKVINAFSYKRKTLSEPKTDSSTALAASTLLEPETDNTTALVGQSQTLTEPEISISTALTAPTLSEPETDTTTTDFVGQTLTEPEVNTTARVAPTSLESETLTSTVLTAPTLLEPEAGTTISLVGQSQTSSEPEVNTTAQVASTSLESETLTVLTAPTLLEPETGTTTALVGQNQTLSEPEINTTARVVPDSLESETLTTTVLTAPTLLEPETGTTIALAGQSQTLSEPEVNTTARVALNSLESETLTTTVLTAPNLLEPETGTTIALVGQSQTPSEPEVNNTARVALTSSELETLATTAPTLLEPETGTTTALVGQSQTSSEPEVNTTARVGPTSLESETLTTSVLTAPTLLEPETGTTIASVGQSQTLSEPEVNTTAPAAQILSEPETFTSGDAQNDMDNVSKCTTLSAKNKSSSPKRSESNSAVNGFGSKENTKDSPNHDIIITQTSEAADGKSQQKTKRGRPPKVVDLKKTSGEDDGKSCKKRKRTKKQIDLLKGTVLDVAPLSVSCEVTHPLPVLKNQVIITTDYQQDWPFIKQSSIWPAIESLLSRLTPPQKPHFSPLKNAKEFNREGLAIAHMVTYLNLIQRLPCLKPTDPVDIIHDNLTTLVDLETHGFDVGPLRGRLNELLCLKYKVSEREDARKELEKCKHEKIVMERKMGRLKVRMRKLEEKMAQNKSMEKMKDEEIARLRSNLHLVRNQIGDLELDFEKVVTTPL